MERVEKAAILTKKDIEFFKYTLNHNGMRFLEFLALFLASIAALVYPVTHFDPRQWMVAPIILGAIAVALFIIAQYWRRYVKVSFLAYDKEYLYVCNMGNACRIAWSALTLENSGVANKNERAGVFLIQINGNAVKMRLFSSFVWLNDFQRVLGELLTHIRENRKEQGE